MGGGDNCEQDTSQEEHDSLGRIRHSSHSRPSVSLVLFHTILLILIYEELELSSSSHPKLGAWRRELRASYSGRQLNGILFLKCIHLSFIYT